MALIEFASRTLPVKVHIKKKSGGRKTLTVSDRESNPLSDTVEFFSIVVFFRGALLPAKSRYLPPPYSFHGGATGFCSVDIPWYLYGRTGTLVPVLPVEVCWQKFTWRKNPEVGKLYGY